MEIRRVTIVGMGTMGSQIAVVCARAGLPTVAVEATPERAEAGLRAVRKFLDGQVGKGKLETAARDQILSNLAAETDLGRGCGESQLVIEAIPEDIALKKKLFAELDRLCPPEAILASNTSTLWISEIASATKRPERCIGTHFLIPAALTPLVEVVTGARTSEETQRTVLAFLARCGKETVTAADMPGFVINRLYLPMVNEAFFALETGLASAEDIDRSCTRGLGFPLGPLAAADAFGLDVLLACMETLHRELGDKYRPSPLLVRLVRAGCLGRKTGRGVYSYG